MDKYRTVDEFLAEQSPPKLEQIDKLREIIMNTDSGLVENIKWNSPNYVHGGHDRITFNVRNKEGKVKLILHMGAKKTEVKAGDPVLADDHGLVAWNSDIRGSITFDDLSDIAEKELQLSTVIRSWLAIPVD